VTADAVMAPTARVSLDLEGLFDLPGGSIVRGCWCMYNRRSGQLPVSARAGEENKRQLVTVERQPQTRKLSNQWQWKNSCILPLGRWLKCSLTWFENVEPSEPVPRTLKVNDPSAVVAFWLKLPQTVNLPV